MLVKNFLLLSAISIAVVSAADKHTSLRHNKKADRGLKKEDEKDKKDKGMKDEDMKDKNKNKNKDGDGETNKASNSNTIHIKFLLFHSQFYRISIKANLQRI